MRAAGLTGFGMTFANMAVTLAKQIAGFVVHIPFIGYFSTVQLELFFTLFLTMVACTILGSELPTTATYIVLATIAAPALLQFKVSLLASHMFVLYFGVIADLTPPVGLAAYAGAGIAGSNPFRTGFTASKLALAGIVAPFVFVYSPELLLTGKSFASMSVFLQTAYIAATSSIGVVLLGMAAVGYCITNANVIERILLAAPCVLLVRPDWQTDMLGAGIFLLVFTIQFFKTKLSVKNPAT